MAIIVINQFFLMKYNFVALLMRKKDIEIYKETEEINTYKALNWHILDGAPA